MANKDTTLDFHDSGQDDVLFEQGDMQTHTFKDFPHSAQDEEEEGDKSELLKEDKKQLSFWTFEYYQQFFDVETRQVFHRVVGSMLPLPHRNFLQTHIRPTPDLYGPFWICTTLVFTTAIAGNLANYLASEGKDYQWKYDFHKVTFSATAIFCYWWLIPTAIYLTLWWRKSQAGYTFLEIICLYGYSLAIYIPISILWVVPYEWFKWTLVIVGALLSGGVLVLTFWSAVKDDTKRVAIIVTSLIFICHLLLATGFVLYFFHVPARTDLQNTTITLAPQIPTSKVNVDKSGGASEVPEGGVKGDAGDSPKAQRLVGPDKTVNPSEKDKGIPVTNSDKTSEAEKTSDEHGDVNTNNNNNNIPSEKTEKAIENDLPSDIKQPETPENTNIENPADTNTENSKRDASLQPEKNEIVPNNNNEKNKGVKKRAAEFRQRFVRKHSKNI